MKEIRLSQLRCQLPPRAVHKAVFLVLRAVPGLLLVTDRRAKAGIHLTSERNIFAGS
jgi:hypothetical protein